MLNYIHLHMLLFGLFLHLLIVLSFFLFILLCYLITLLSCLMLLLIGLYLMVGLLLRGLLLSLSLGCLRIVCRLGLLGFWGVAESGLRTRPLFQMVSSLDTKQRVVVRVGPYTNQTKN